MKNISVQIISREIIKPSLPNPEPLRRHQLSFIDQFQPPIYMPFIIFYAKEDSAAATITNQQKFDLMKKSLSEVLATFRPLAGRIRDNTYVDCGDQGMPFVQAIAGCSLSDLRRNPNPPDHNRLLSVEIYDSGDVPALVQVTFFQCGGMAVFLAMSHKVADGFSFLMFFNSWASVAQGGAFLCTPRFDSATHFPPKNISGYEPSMGIQTEGIAAKMFAFDADAISAIREKFNDRTGGDPRRPSRVEALSAFIWKRFMESTQPENDRAGKRYTVANAANLRTRMQSPSLVKDSFGNFSVVFFTDLSGDGGGEGYGIIKKFREGLRKINEYDTDCFLELLKDKSRSVPTGEEVPFSFSSLCRMPFYEGDFGWGKPEWIGSVRFVYKNFVIFLETKNGDGVEAWINLEEEDMKKFEMDEELLSYVSPITSI